MRFQPFQNGAFQRREPRGGASRISVSGCTHPAPRWPESASAGRNRREG
jgi:hypothetical protein